MSRVVMLLSNAFRPDPRVDREASALQEAGHQVTIICWDRQAEFPIQETLDGVEIRRVHSVHSGYGSGWRQIFYTPRFWRAALELASPLHPDIVHCHDLDTLYIGARLKKHLGCRLVYDAHEDYPALMSLYLPAPILPALSGLERLLLRQVDFTITASTVFADKLRQHGVKCIETIGNYAPLAPFDAITPQDVSVVRNKLGLSNQDFVVAYIGGFTRNRLLLPLIEAARELPLANFLLWGDGYQREAVEQAVSTVPNTRYLGWLPAGQVPVHTRMADVIFYCLKPDYPGAIYNAPNTLSNAMAAQTPILANDVGDLGRIVRSTGCGLLMEPVTVPAIREGLNQLRRPEVRLRLGRAGRQAAEREYNWDQAAKQLAGIYNHLQ